MNENNCIFCKIAKKEIQAKVVFESDKLVAFEDLKPQAPVHILVIPKAHIPKASDLKNEDAVLIGELILAAKALAYKNGIDKSGYRIILNCGADAGQEVFHMHLHLMGGRKFSWPPG